MKRESIRSNIKSVIGCLMAHPDNIPNSEFADRIDDLIEIEKYLNIQSVNKRYEYRFKAQPSYGGYVESIIEADSREEAERLLNKRYSRVVWVSSRH